MRPCYNCLEKRDLFLYNADARKKSLSETISVLASGPRQNSASNVKLENLSLTHGKPVL